MKYSKPMLILYGICFLKLICTVLFMTIPMFDVIYLSVISLPVCLTVAYNKEIALLCLVIVMITILLWLSGILLSLLGIKFKKSRKASVIIFTIATIVDLLTVFLSTNPVLIVSCSVVSVLTLIVCILCFMHKDAPKEA